MNGAPFPLGTSVSVCEPQSVCTDARCRGAVGSLMSKTRTPSHAPGTAAFATFVLAQLGPDCGVSPRRTAVPPD